MAGWGAGEGDEPGGSWALGPLGCGEDLEGRIRAALLQAMGEAWIGMGEDAGPELPEILEVTELLTYYHMEELCIHKRLNRE